MQIISVNVEAREIPPHQDTDIVFRLDKAEVDTLNNDVTRAAIAAALVAAIPAVGAVAAVYVNERINEIVSGSGPNGCDVEMTIRDGVSLHVFSVHAR